MIFLYKTYLIDYEYKQTSTNKKNILFLHGFLGNKNSFYYTEKILSPNFNTITISLPPNSTDNFNLTPLTLDDYTEIVINILKLLNIKSVILICHSFGFRVALKLFSKNVKIEKIIITGGAGVKINKSFFQKLYDNNKQILMKNDKTDFYYNLFASSEYKSFNKIDKITFKNIVNFDTTKYTKRIKIPTLLFWGKQDTATPISIAKFLKKNIAKSKLIIIKKGTHFAYLENRDYFNFCCKEFLKNDC